MALPFASTADLSAVVLLVRLEFATVVVVAAAGLRPTVVRLVRERKWHLDGVVAAAAVGAGIGRLATSTFRH